MPGIIFDCDGTLLDSLDQALESFNFALQRMGLPKHTPAQIKRYFGAGGDRILTALLGGDRARGLQAFEYYKEHHTELARTMRLHDGIPELLDALLTAGVPLGIMTGRHADDLAIVLKPHGIAPRFLALVSDNMVEKSKPAPDGVLLAAKLMNLPPTECFYVGDSPMDIRSARAADAHGVAALWDKLVKREEMVAERPALFAEKPAQVFDGFTRTFRG